MGKHPVIAIRPIIDMGAGVVYASRSKTRPCLWHTRQPISSPETSRTQMEHQFSASSLIRPSAGRGGGLGGAEICPVSRVCGIDRDAVLGLRDRGDRP